MKVVKFLHHWSCYNAGDIAGFLPAHAEQLIAKKIAVAHVEAEPPLRKGADKAMVKKD